MKENRTAARFLILLLMVLVLAGCLPVRAESYDAGTMRLLRYEGEVEILDKDGQPRFVLENVRFASGETMQTGSGSMASVSLDSAKIVTLGADTRVSFSQESSHLLLRLLEGTIFLDVQEKLDENESLDIQTSTMTIGIRGTMVCVSHSEDEQASRSQIMLLEGKTDLDYLDASGSHRLLPLSAGQKADVLQSGGDGGGATPAVSQLSAGDIPVLVRRIISEDPAVRQRVLEGSEEAAAIFSPAQEAPVPETVNPYPDQGDWTWNETVTLVAQSASKLYDGEALTRSSNVLVYGLPGDFTIDVSARGSQTDAGSSENMVSDCVIRNAMGEDVTGHFKSIRKISGQLVVNPIPVSVWTGSAEKYYDGEPLTNPEAGVKVLDHPVSEQPDWGNTSVVSQTSLGSEAMIAVSGSTWVHAVNPITKESQDIELLAGQRLTVCLKNEQTQDSIYYQIDTLKVEDLPEEILILYANNPGLLSKACEETGWDPALLADRINALEIPEESAETKNGLVIQSGVEDRLLTDSASVRIDIDSAITNYSTRALTEKEAHFTPVVLNANITVTATGSQTEVGSSENGYTISWGGANENNYIVTREELGTLTVLPRPIDGLVVITAASDSKTYDGIPLRNGGYTVEGLPAGYRLAAAVSGSRTDAGTAENLITDYHIYGPSGEDATDQFINVFTDSGELAVNSAPLWITTGSAEKVYDGGALENAEASIAGLVNGETAAISATGFLTGRTGTADNTYEITWGTAKKSNYYIASEKLGTLTIEPLGMSIDFGGAAAVYNGSTYLPDPVLTYTNGPHAGETLAGIRMRAADALFRFILFTQDTLDVSVTGMGTDAGTYSLSGSVSSPDENLFCMMPSFSGMTLTISPREMTVETPSASKPYDGTALTAGPAKVTGLVSGETAAVTATGSRTAVGESENTYAIAWGSAKESNYTVSEALGTLQVTANAGPVTLTAVSAEKVYDGTPLTAEGVTAEGLPAGFTVTAAVSGSRTDAGSSENRIISYTILDSEGSDVTGNFTGITAVSGTLKVTPAELTVTTGSASKAYDGTALTNAEVSVTGLTGADQARVTVTATGSQTGLGESENTYSIDWGGADKDNYTIIESLGKLTVEGYATPVVFTALSAEKTYDGKPLTAGVTAEGLPAGFTFAASAEGSQTAVGTCANRVASYQIFNEAAEDVTVTFINVTVSDGTLTVKKAALTIGTPDAEKPYDGTDLTAAGVTVTGLAESEEISVTVSGRQRAVGSSENSFTVNWGSVDSANYTVAETPGTLTVTQNDTPVTLTAQSVSMTYDGEAKAGFGGVTVEGLPPAVGIMAEAQWSAKDAGEYPLNVSYYLTDDELGGIPNDYFTNITTVSGTLTVLPAALTVTTGSAEKKYDGTALTNAEASVTGLAGPDKDQVTVTADGSRTAVGESENTYTISWGTAKESNYTVTKALGTLKVTANDGAVTLTAASAEKVYDGTPLTADGVDAEGLPAGFTVTASVSGSQTDAGTCKNEIVSYRILDGNGGDVTANFSNVTTADGTLTVNRVRLNLSFTGGGTHVYDGSEHAFNVVAESPDMDDVDSAIRTVSDSPLTFAWVVRTSCGKLRLGGFPLGGRTDAGTYELNCTYTFMEGNADNFLVTVTPDTAVITPAPLTVSTGSAAKVYDGAALTAPASVTGLIGADASRVHVTATGAITDAGTAENTYTIDWGSANAGNYEITEEIGTLTVEKRSFHFTTYTQNAAGTKNYYAAVPYCGENYQLGAGYSFSAAQTNYDDFTLEYSKNDPGSADMKITWTWGDSFTFHAAGGSGKDAGLYPVYGGVEFHSGNSANYDVDYSCYPLEITPAELTVTTGSASRAYDGTALTNAEVSVAGLAEPDKDLVTVTASGSQTEVGESDNTYTIAWGTVKESNYTVSKSLGKLTVTANDGMVTLTAASAEKVYDGTALTADGATAEGLPSGFTVTAAVSGSQTDAGSCESTITSYTILDGANQDVTGNYTNVATVTGTLTVTPAVLTVTTGSASKVYDGTALTNAEAFITGLVGGETAAVTATGSITTAGTAENTYAIEWGTAKAGNYTLAESLGTLEVTPNDTLITITSGDGYMRYKPYDCIVKNSDYTVEGLPAGFTLTAEITGEQSWAVGSSPNTIASYTITKGSEDVTSCFSNVQKAEGTLTVGKAIVTIWSDDSEKTYSGTPLTGGTIHWTGIYGMDNAQNGITITHDIWLTDAGSAEDKFSVYWNYPELESLYEIEEHPGTLTVKPAQLTVTTGSASKAYDGTALTNAEASVSGLAAGETVTVTATGSQTAVGTGENTYTIEWVTAKAGNYTLTENLGTLTVAPNDTPITFRASSAEKVYDGTALTSGGVTAEGLPAGFTFEAAASGAQTDAGTGDNEVTSYKILKDGSDVTAGFTGITTENGTLKVTPATATVTTGSGSKMYDGAPLTRAEASISGLAGGETAAVTATGSQTDVGTGVNTYSIEWGTAKADNYTLTENLGELQVTVNSTAVTFTAGSASKPYDGTALTLNQVTASGLPSGLSFTASASGSRTDAGTGENTVFSYVILDGTNADVTANFNNITTVPGELTVTPRKVSFDLNGTSRKYNSLPLFPSKVTGEDEDGSVLVPTSENSIGDYYLGLPYKLESVFSLVGSDEITVTSGPEFESGCTDVGSYTIIPQIVFSSGDAANYEFSYINNIFSVTRMNIRVDVLAGEPVEYDGAFHTGDVKVYVEDAELTDRSYYDASKKWRYDSDELSIYVEVEGGRTDAGESDLTCSCSFSTYYNSDPSGNINLTVNDGVRLTVLPKPATVSTGSAEKVYDGTALTAPGTLTGLVASDESKVTWNATGTITDAGTASNTYTINWGDVNPNNYAITENLGTLIVKPAPIKVSTKDISESKTYDGNPSPVNTARPTISGWHEAGIEAVSQPNQITDVGEVPLKYEMNWGSAKESNYEITDELGTLSITPLPVTFDMNCYDMNFNGYPALPDGIEGTYGGGGIVEKANEEFIHDSHGMPVSLTAEFNLIGSDKVRLYTEGQVNVGSFTLEPEPEMLSGKAGNYVFSYTDNTGSVSPLEAQFSLGGGYPVYYDGQFHGGDLRVYCDNEGFFSTDKVNDTQWRVSCYNGDAIDVTITGGGTELGTYTLSCTYAFAPGTPANYDISFWGETLEIKTIDTPVTFTAESLSKTYDGTPLSGGAVTMTDGWLLWDYTWTGTVSGSRTDAGIGENGLEVHIFNENGIDVTGTYTNLTLVKGTLTVEKAPLTVKTSSASKAYDGTPLEGGEATVTGLVNGETITVTTSSLTEVGTAPNDYTIDWGTVNKDNYTITDEIGTLEVTAADTAVTLTAASAEKYYDGTALTSNEITAAGLPGGFTVEGTTSGSQTNAGSTANKIETYKIFNPEHEDVTGSFTEVTLQDGMLTVKPIELTLTPHLANNVVCVWDNLNDYYDLENSLTGEITPAMDLDIHVIEGELMDVRFADISFAVATPRYRDFEPALGEHVIDHLEVEYLWYGNLDNVKITYVPVAYEVVPIEFSVDLAGGTYIGDSLSRTPVVTLLNSEWAGEEFECEFVSYDDALMTESWTAMIHDCVMSLSVQRTAAGGTSWTLQGSASIPDYDDSLIHCTWTNDMLNIIPLQIRADLGGGEYTYGEEVKKDPALTYLNGPHAGETVAFSSETWDGDGTSASYDFVLYNGVTMSLDVSFGVLGDSEWNYVMSPSSNLDGNSGYDIAYVNNTYVVNPAPLTVTTESASKAYDGTALKNEGASVSGLVHGETVTVAATGSQTDVGSSDNTYSIDWGTTEEGHYTLIENLGTLEVTVNDTLAVTLTAASDSRDYDGTALENSGVTASGLPEGFTVTATASGSQTDAGSSKNTVDDGWVIRNAASDDVTAYFTNIIRVDGTLTVRPAKIKVSTKDISESKTYDGKPSPVNTDRPTITGTLYDADIEAVSKSNQITDVGTVPLQYEMNWGSAKESNYEITDELGTLTITQAEAAVTTGSASKPYDGTPLTNTEADIDGLVNDETAAVTANGSQTEVGSSENGYTIVWGTAKSANYSVTEELGTLEVTKNNAEITLTAASASKEYDGNALTDSSVTADGLPAGFTVEATASGSQTDAGESANVVNDGYVIKNASGEDKTANFTNIRKVDGKLTVTKATVTVTTNTASKTYDGTALFGSDASVSGLVSGETVTVNATGSRTDAGTSDNTYAIIWDNAKESNYTVHEELGKLTVEKRQFSASSFFTDDISGEPCREAVYNGKEYYVNIGVSAPLAGYSVDHSPLYQHEMDLTVTWWIWGDSCTFHATGSARDAGEHSTTCVVEFSSGNPDNYEIEITCDKLKITPAPITVTARSYEKKYDGSPLPEETDPPVISGSFYGDDYLYAEHTGETITDVGTEPRGCTYSFGGDTNPDNYSVSVEQGSLTVTKRNLIVRSSDAQKPYDGEPLTMHEYSIEGDGLAPDETITVDFTGSQTEPDSSPNTFTVIWDTAKEGNYDLVPVYGTLTVTEAEESGLSGMFSLGTRDANKADVSETDPTAGITDETGEMGEPPETDPSADPPDETGDQATADQQAPPGSGLSDGSGADGSEPDPQKAEPADADGASGPDAAESQSGEAADTEETAVPDSAADPSGTEQTDSARQLTSRFTFSAMPSGGQAENSLRDNAADDGDAAEDTAGAEVTDEAAGDAAWDDSWTAEPLYLEIDLGGMTMEYGRARDSALKPKLTYMSGDYAGLTVDPEMEAPVPGGCEAVFRLLTGDTLTLTVSGFTSFDSGVYPLAGSCRFSGGAAWNTVVDYTNDTVTVTPSQLTVASLSAEKDYDGEPLVMHESYIDGLAYGETIMVNYTGSQTEPGSSENTFYVSWGTARETNYLLNTIYGTLTVNDPVMSGVPKPADTAPEPTAAPAGDEGGDGEPEATPTPSGDEGADGDPEPTPTPPGEGEEGSGETDPAADSPGEGEDEGGEPDPDANPPGDPPASDGGEEGGTEPDPAADPPEESGGTEESTEPGPPADPPEESGWHDSAEPDLLPSDPEESGGGAEESSLPEPSSDPPDAGGFSEPDPVIPDSEPSGGHEPQETVSDPPGTGE